MQRNRSITRSPRPAAQAGFSLIEIIIVTVLIGGIVAFAASRILGGGDKARYRLAQSMVQTMAEKVHSYQTDTGSLPGSLEDLRSEEHTSELQSLMRISYAVFCLKKKKTSQQYHI